MFERGGTNKPEIDEEQVKELHAKIGEMAMANDFLSRKINPWIGKLGGRWLSQATRGPVTELFRFFGQLPSKTHD